jgi:RAB protein geranylgeranyltransferase component A
MEDRIEPNRYDVIVLDAGLPESVLAASIAACGKSVLHLDYTGFYGSHWTSLSFSQMSSFAARGGHLPLPYDFLSQVIRNLNTSDCEGFNGNNSGLTQALGIDGVVGMTVLLIQEEFFLLQKM